MVTPIASFSFDEPSGIVVDYSGNGREWSLNNNAIRATGHTGNGLAKNDVGFPVLASPAFGQTDNRTFMFWMQGQGNSTWIFRFYIISEDTGAWGLYNIGGILNLRLRIGGVNTNTQFPFPLDEAWHHYAFTYDGANAKFYIDGILVATSVTALGPLDSGDRIELMEGSLTSQVLDDIRIFDQTLDGPEIVSYMNKPVSADDMAGASSILIYNGTEWVPTVKKIFSGSWLDA
jgi:concanavalin A-like lectin/glucanase superfamily protein